MTPKTAYLLTVVMAVLALFVSHARAECIEFSVDGVIEYGDVYDCVRILNDATVDMTGGYITDYIALTDTATLNISAGWVKSIDANDQSALNITGGEVRDIRAYDSTNIDISTGLLGRLFTNDSVIVNISGGYLHAFDIHGQSIVNIYDVQSLQSDLIVYFYATMNIYGGHISFRRAKIYSDCPVNIFGGSVSFDYTDICAPFNILGGNITFADGLHACEDGTSIYGYDFTYDPNLRLFSSSLLYGGQITIYDLPPNDYEYLNFLVSAPSDLVAANIDRTRVAGTILLKLTDELLHKQHRAYDALQQLLESGDYGDFTKSDVVKARQTVHTAIRHELQSKSALQKSIDNLNDALDLLNWYSPPYDPPHDEPLLQPPVCITPKRQLRPDDKPPGPPAGRRHSRK